MNQYKMIAASVVIGGLIGMFPLLTSGKPIAAVQTAEAVAEAGQIQAGSQGDQVQADAPGESTKNNNSEATDSLSTKLADISSEQKDSLTEQGEATAVTATTPPPKKPETKEAPPVTQPKKPVQPVKKVQPVQPKKPAAQPVQPKKTATHTVQVNTGKKVTTPSQSTASQADGKTAPVIKPETVKTQTTQSPQTSGTTQIPKTKDTTETQQQPAASPGQAVPSSAAPTKEESKTELKTGIQVVPGTATTTSTAEGTKADSAAGEQAP